MRRLTWVTWLVALAALAAPAAWAGTGAPAVAVLPIATGSPTNEFRGDGSGLDELVAAALGRKLSRAGFAVTDRATAGAALSAAGIAAPKSSWLERRTARRIARVLGVRYLLSGSVTGYGATATGARTVGTLRLTLNLMDTSTGEIGWAWSRTLRSSVTSAPAATVDRRLHERLAALARNLCVCNLAELLDGDLDPSTA